MTSGLWEDDVEPTHAGTLLFRTRICATQATTTLTHPVKGVVEAAAEESRFNIRMMESNGNLQIETDRGELDISAQDQMVNGWIVYAGKKLKEISGGSIWVTIGDREYDVWIVIAKRDLGLVRRIASSYGEVIEQMKALVTGLNYKVDFHILYAQGQRPEDIIPSRAVQVAS
jgi:hypothetical protein